MVKLNGIDLDLNYLTCKDIVILEFIKGYPLKTAKQLSFISTFNYVRLTESLSRLLKQKLIVKTKEHPARYMIDE